MSDIDEQQIRATVSEFVDFVVARDVEGVAASMRYTPAATLAVMCAEVLGEQREAILTTAAELKHVRHALSAAVQRERRARREERDAVEEIRLENASLVKENRRLRLQAKREGLIAPAGMTAERAWEIAHESEARKERKS